MTKLVYKFNGKDDFTTAFVEDDYVLQDNETFDNPGNVLLPVTFSNGKIVGATQAEFEAEQLANQQVPEGANAPTGPSNTEKAIAALTLQIAQNKANQDTVNAQLLLATAKQTVKETN